MAKNINQEIIELLKSNNISVDSLNQCWEFVKKDFKKSADSFIKNYFGDSSKENWLNPGAIDLLDFSQINSEYLEGYKENSYALLQNPKADMPTELKIIYAFLWKNAGMDMTKIPAIITGLLQKKESDNNDNAIIDCYGFTNLYKDAGGTDKTIFYQYGLYLKSKKDGNVNFSEVEPIVDQHSLRAWSKLFEEDINIEYENNEPIQNSYNLATYKSFYQNIVKTASKDDVKKSKEAYYLLNAIMFVIGKGIK